MSSVSFSVDYFQTMDTKTMILNDITLNQLNAKEETTFAAGLCLSLSTKDTDATAPSNADSAVPSQYAGYEEPFYNTPSEWDIHFSVRDTENVEDDISTENEVDAHEEAEHHTRPNCGNKFTESMEKSE